MAKNMAEKVLTLEDQQLRLELWQEFFVGVDVHLAEPNNRNLVPALLATGGELSRMVAVVKGERRLPGVKTEAIDLWRQTLSFRDLSSLETEREVTRRLFNLDSRMYSVGRGMVVTAGDCDLELGVIQVFPRPAEIEAVIKYKPDPLLLRISQSGGEGQFFPANEMATAAVDMMVAAASRNYEVMQLLRVISESPNSRAGVDLVLKTYRQAPGEVLVLVGAAEAVCNAFLVWVAMLGDLYRSVDDKGKASVAALTSYLVRVLGGAFLRGWSQGELLPTMGGVGSALGTLVEARSRLKYQTH